MKTFEQLVMELPEWSTMTFVLSITDNRHALLAWRTRGGLANLCEFDTLGAADAMADQLDAYLKLISSDN